MPDFPREFPRRGEIYWAPLDKPRYAREDSAMIKTSAGQPIEVRDAFGRVLRRVATGPVDPGYDFAVVWAAREEEWDAAQVEGREPDATPWPIEDVSVLETA